MASKKDGRRNNGGQRGKAGLPKTGGIKRGDVMNGPRLNTHDMIRELRSSIAYHEDGYGWSLVGKAFDMIEDPAVENFVKKDLLLGMLQISTPKMKAVEMQVDTPPTQIIYKTNISAKPVNGKRPDQLSSASDVFELSPEP